MTNVTNINNWLLDVAMSLENAGRFPLAAHDATRLREMSGQLRAAAKLAEAVSLVIKTDEAATGVLQALWPEYESDPVVIGACRRALAAWKEANGE